MPIGNLTSQIFANIYLNELDRFIKHELKVKQYLRYGDDFIVIEPDLQKLKALRAQMISFLDRILKLKLNPKNDQILRANKGLKFLGMMIYSKGRKLNRRIRRRIETRLSLKNAGSYYGLLEKHGNQKAMKGFYWQLVNLANEEWLR